MADQPRAETLTVGGALQLEVLAPAGPVVHAGGNSMDRPVRWAHVSELPEIAAQLRGGELLLTTGIALDDDARSADSYVSSLARAGACGVILELGQRFRKPPRELLRAAQRYDFPFVTLRRPVPFIAVTESIHARILEYEVHRARALDEATAQITRLCVDRVPLETVLAEIARMVGAPVVLETADGRPLGASAHGGQVAELLRDWPRRSRAARVETPSAAVAVVTAPEEWLVADAGPGHRSHDLRLVVLPAVAPTELQQALTSRAAQLLALGHPGVAGRAMPDRVLQAMDRLVADAAARTWDEPALRARAAALGTPLGSRLQVGIVRVPTGEETVALQRDLLGACGSGGLHVVVAAWNRDELALIVDDDASLGGGSRVDVRERLARLVRRVARSAVGRPTVAFSAAVTTWPLVSRALAEASSVAANAQRRDAGGPGPTRGYHLLQDLPLEVLAEAMAGSSEVLAIAATLMEPLRRAGQKSAKLDEFLSVYIACGGSKTMTAQRLKISRPTVYARVLQLSELLGLDVEVASHRTVLHLAHLLVTDRGFSNGHEPAVTCDQTGVT
jgi:PucR family transcriptional regulator, purine catabolism regulatory protein